MTRETVALETPASAAISFILGFAIGRSRFAPALPPVRGSGLPEPGVGVAAQVSPKNETDLILWAASASCQV